MPEKTIDNENVLADLEAMGMEKAPTPSEIIELVRSDEPADKAKGLRALFPDDTVILVRDNGKGIASIGSTNSPPMHLMGCLVWGSVRMGEFLGVELKWNQAQEDPQTKLVVASGAALPGPGSLIS